MKIGWRSLGGIAGAVAALAGGIGAAVGFYSLPDPTSASVSQDAYIRADERAIAVLFRDNGDGTHMELRVDAGRGASAGEDASARALQFPNARGEQNVAVHFDATIQTCNDQGECYDWQQYTAEPWMPMSFEVDPLMQSARFTGYLNDCEIDIVWTGEGEIAPFTGVPAINGGTGPWGARIDADNGFAEASRVAPADIEACFGSFSDVNGYLSRGVRRTLTSADAGFTN